MNLHVKRSTATMDCADSLWTEEVLPQKIKSKVNRGVKPTSHQ